MVLMKIKWNNASKLIGRNLALALSKHLITVSWVGRVLLYHMAILPMEKLLLTPGFWKNYHAVSIKSYARQVSHCFQHRSRGALASFPLCHRGEAWASD